MINYAYAGDTYCLGDEYSTFWGQFSKWMAESTTGKFTFWLTAGNAKGLFPPLDGYDMSFFEEFELPNLQVRFTILSYGNCVCTFSY